jgi:oligopeptidase A
LENPLLLERGLPDFAAIDPAHVEPAIRKVLAEQRSKLQQAESDTQPAFAWALSLERMQDAVRRVWAPIVHLNSVCSTPELRDAYNSCLPLITDFWLEYGQSEKLYEGFEHLQQNAVGRTGAETKLIDEALKDLRLAGVALNPERRRRFRELTQQLTAKQAKFEQNLMDATDAFRLHETRSEALTGLPAQLLERARQAAEKDGLDGWLLFLDPPTYTTVMAQAEAEALRRSYYEAWVTRASDQGPHAGRWDNAALIEDILALRHESAQLLGFSSFAQLSLATKMAVSPVQVLGFLQDLAAKSRGVAETELVELEAHAGRRLQAWDLAFYSERLKRERFELSAEELRPFFPLPRVLEGLFRVAGQLFKVRIVQHETLGPWHPTVAYYEILDSAGRLIGGIFTDMYARPNKRGGAWMDEALTRARLPDFEQLPVAHLVCNFSPPTSDAPCLLTHDEVVTLFHEFGHALQHLLTEIDFPSIAGINGVPWDAVELPSQFFENYAWLPEVLPWISGHHRSGETMPRQKLATLKASRSFQAGLAMMRQLEFALFDFRLHAEYDPRQGARVEALLAEIRAEVSLIETPSFNRFAATFSHIFGGGYAAGYYSYKWAEVLAADAFSAFEEAGGFCAATAERFRRCVLASGGSRDALEAFVEFRGRPPSLDPLLRQSGIAA